MDKSTKLYFHAFNVLLLIILFASYSHSSSRIPYGFISSTVSISGPSGTGSGLFVRTNKSAYLITARHVIFNDKMTLLNNTVELISYSNDPNDLLPYRIELDLVKLNKNNHVHFHKSHDIAMIRIQQRPNNDNTGKFAWIDGIKIHSTPNTKNDIGIEMNDLRLYKDVSIGNDTLIFGYPNSIGLKELPQIDFSRPLLRKGVIAGKNNTMKTIIIDCPVYGGNSGGPVMEIEEEWITITNYNIIGIVTQFIPVKETWLNIDLKYANINLSNSGYAVVEPADYLIELIKQYD